MSFVLHIAFILFIRNELKICCLQKVLSLSLTLLLCVWHRSFRNGCKARNKLRFHFKLFAATNHPTNQQTYSQNSAHKHLRNFKLNWSAFRKKNKYFSFSFRQIAFTIWMTVLTFHYLFTSNYRWRVLALALAYGRVDSIDWLTSCEWVSERMSATTP